MSETKISKKQVTIKLPTDLYIKLKISAGNGGPYGKVTPHVEDILICFLKHPDAFKKLMPNRLGA